MAKQLLGKEVTAALNEKIKANVAALKEKGINPTLGIIRVGENGIASIGGLVTWANNCLK